MVVGVTVFCDSFCIVVGGGYYFIFFFRSLGIISYLYSSFKREESSFGVYKGEIWFSWGCMISLGF